MNNVGLTPHIYDDTLTPGVDLTFLGHLRAAQSGAPVPTNLGANVTSANPTGNDSDGFIFIAMAGGLAANTRIVTLTWVVAFTTTPRIRLIDETSGVGLAVVNFYLLAQATGVSIDVAADQALVAGNYKCGYQVVG